MYNIKKRIALLLSFTMMFLTAFETLPALSTKAAKNSQSMRLLVKYKDAKDSNKAKDRVSKRSKKVNNRMINNKVEILEIEQAENIYNIVQDLENMEEVEYVQEDFELEILGLPNDPELQNQWGILNNGQEINRVDGTAGMDVNILPVLEQKDKLSEVLVAVLDTGIDINHYDLKSNMYYEGWNFVEDSSDVTKDSAHGTAVAGIISAEHNNDGIAGVANNVKILPVKFIENGVGYTSDAIAGILYAKEKGAKIINCSFGSPNYNQALYEVMKENKDILFVCAAGNNGSYGGVYPAAFELPNVISVASIDNRGELSATSNYGDRITIAAPGEDILTSVTDSVYGCDYTSGTSMAAAFVTGGVAMYAGKYPDKNAAEIEAAVKQSVRQIDGLEDKVKTGGILDVNELLKQADVKVEESDIELPDGFELPEDFEAKAEYLRNTQLYSRLANNEKEELCSLFGILNETMELYEGAGFNTGDAIYRAFIKERLDISVEKIEELINVWERLVQEQPKILNEETGKYFDAETGLSKLYSLINQLKSLTEINHDYFEADREIIIDMLFKGYEPYQFLYALIVSKFLEVDIEEIIAKSYADISIEELNFSEEDKTILSDFCRDFSVKFSFITEYLINNDLTIKGFRDKITNYQARNNIFAVDEQLVPLAYVEGDIPYYYYRTLYYSNYSFITNKTYIYYTSNGVFTKSIQQADIQTHGPSDSKTQSDWSHGYDLGWTDANMDYYDPDTGELVEENVYTRIHSTASHNVYTTTITVCTTIPTNYENYYDEVITEDATITNSINYTNQNVLYKGNVTIAANVTLDNSTMTVLGTLNIDSYVLTMSNNSKLHVGKDLRIQKKGGENDIDSDGYGETGGFMSLYGNNKLEVYRDFYTQTPSSYNFGETSFDLEFELHGNFYQVGENTCFNDRNTVKTIFAGIGEQYVYFDKYHNTAKLGKIKVENANKRILFMTPVHTVELLEEYPSNHAHYIKTDTYIVWMIRNWHFSSFPNLRVA